MSDPFVLETQSLVKEFKGFVAVDDVNLKVQRGHIHALIGPNGAGKTTVFNLLTKFLIPTRGKILFKGEDITSMKSAAIARKGVVRSFQISAVFPHMTALENIRVALQSFEGNSFRFWKSGESLNKLNERCMELLDSVGLTEFANTTTVELAYGRKREFSQPNAPWNWPPLWPWSRSCCCWMSPHREWAVKTWSGSLNWCARPLKAARC